MTFPATAAMPAPPATAASGHDRQPRSVRRLRRATAAITTTGLLLAVAPLALAPAADRAAAGAPARPSGTVTADGSDLRPVSHRVRHPRRLLKTYRVRPGDTPASVATRYHAWTAQLIAMNHSSVLYAGEVIVIPVVRSAQRDCRVHRHHRTHKRPHGHGHGHGHGRPKGRDRDGGGPHADHRRGWHHADAGRPRVRRVIVSKAVNRGLNPDLALAIAWQESGWQQRRVSSAGALGAMQIMPATAEWMSDMVGRHLNPRDLHHNAVAGTTLIRWLRSEARLRRAVAGYYQGLAGVRRDGMYPSTRRYVADVLALKHRLAGGWRP